MTQAELARAGRGHAPDDHRHRAGPLLAVPGDGVPDRSRVRRDARRRLSIRVTRRRHDMTTPTTTDRGRRAPLPPRWVIRAAWTIHRAIYAPHARPAGPPPPDARAVGDDAAHRRSGAARAGAARHPRLLRGWSEPGHHGHERLGRRGAGLVAQSPGEPRHHGRAARRPARGPRPCGHTARSGPACGRAGPSTTARRRSRAGRRGDPARPRSSSSRHEPAQSGSQLP